MLLPLVRGLAPLVCAVCTWQSGDMVTDGKAASSKPVAPGRTAAPGSLPDPARCRALSHHQLLLSMRPPLRPEARWQMGGQTRRWYRSVHATAQASLAARINAVRPAARTSAMMGL